MSWSFNAAGRRDEVIESIKKVTAPPWTDNAEHCEAAKAFIINELRRSNNDVYGGNATLNDRAILYNVSANGHADAPGPASTRNITIRIEYTLAEPVPAPVATPTP